jgi:hypothetical protein
MDKETYTKIFLTQTNEAVSPENITAKMRLIWKNCRRSAGGLRLTDSGLDYLKNDLNLAAYEIPFPLELDLKPQVLLYLDKFINCPYYITDDAITVFNERNAVELHLFSGDVQRFGFIKAMRRELP